jgi:hypothetical protein
MKRSGGGFMRKYAVIGFSIFISAAVWAYTFAGKQEVTYHSDTIAMKVGSCEVDVSEVMIHFLFWRNQIESQWGTKMWDARTGTDKDGSAITYEDDVKEDIKKELIVEKSLVQAAREKKITLTDAESESCRQEAEDAIRGFDNEEVIAYGITVDKVSDYYEDLALMSKLCEKKLKQVSSDYKIKDYVTTTVYGVLFPTYEIDEDGNQIEMTSKNKKDVKKQAEEAWQKVLDGESLKKIVKEYGLSYAGEKSYRSGEEEEDSLWNSIKNLKDGEYSGVLETEQGYSIIQMVSCTDQEKTKEAFESALEEAKREAFLEYYTDKYEDEYHTKIEEDIWDVLPLASEDHET